MRKTVIADSSSLFSVFSPDDTNNSLALKISKQILEDNSAIGIPSDVFSEMLNIVGKKVSHRVAQELGEKLLTEQGFFIFDTTNFIQGKALEKFSQQPNSVSFTDCIVMAVADAFHTKEIFGFDEAFYKNGYTRLGLDK